MQQIKFYTSKIFVLPPVPQHVEDKKIEMDEKTSGRNIFQCKYMEVKQVEGKNGKASTSTYSP